MRRATPLLLLLLLAGPTARADDTALWKAAFALEEPGKTAAAEATLRQGGAPAYAVLSKLARAGGREQALAVAGEKLPCPSFMRHRFGRGGEEAVVPKRAARLAGQLLEDAALRQQVLASAEPFDKAMALVASARVPGALAGALESLRGEEDPWFLLWADGFAQCNTMRLGASAGAVDEALQKEAAHLAERAKAVRGPQECQEPSDLGPDVLEELVTGSAQANGWSRSGEVLQVSVRRAAGQFLSLSPACAVAAYDAAAARKTYVPGLLLPVATEQTAAQDSRRAAAERAIRDLEQFPEHERNRLAAELVNAGHAVPRKVTFKSAGGFVSEEELAAAARQGDKEAKAAIETHLFCRDTHGQSGVAILGWVGTKKAADTAYQFGQRCPSARAAATAALLRLKDARALKLLPQALEGHQSFGDQALKRAALEMYTPRLGQQLSALAAKGNARAADLVEALKAARVMKAD